MTNVIDASLIEHADDPSDTGPAVIEDWPILRLVGHLEGVARRDVNDYLKGLVQRHFIEHENERSFVSVMKWRGGWLYELCLGGDGKNRLKALARYLDEHPSMSRLVLPAATRCGEVYVNTNGRLVYRLLPETTDAPSTQLEASGNASNLYPTYGGVLTAGAAFLLVGCAVFALGVGASATGAAEQARMDMEIQQLQRDAHEARNLSVLPIRNMPDGEGLLNQPRAVEYIEAVTYEQGRWQPPVTVCVGAECPTQVASVGEGQP